MTATDLATIRAAIFEEQGLILSGPAAFFGSNECSVINTSET